MAEAKPNLLPAICAIALCGCSAHRPIEPRTWHCYTIVSGDGIMYPEMPMQLTASEYARMRTADPRSPNRRSALIEFPCTCDTAQIGSGK